MRNAIVIAALLAAVPAQQAPSAGAGDGVAAYRAGRFAEAYATFAAQLAAAGDGATNELRWNTALAALRVQRSADAEAAVQPWLAGGDATRRADAEFVGAMAAFQRGERAALAAQLPDAEPLAWTMALQAVQRAEAGFVRAASARGAWPEATRNAERARARLAELQKLRDAAQQAKAKQQPEPAPPPPSQRQPTPEEAPTALATEPLRADEVAALLQRVERKEREKRSLRRERQQQATAAGERGW